MPSKSSGRANNNGVEALEVFRIVLEALVQAKFFYIANSRRGTSNMVLLHIEKSMGTDFLSRIIKEAIKFLHHH